MAAFFFIGQKFQTSDEFYARLSKYESRMGGFFEVNKTPISSLDAPSLRKCSPATTRYTTRIICKCSGSLDSKERRCPAFVAGALDDKNAVTIIDSNFTHWHAGSAIASGSSSSNLVSQPRRSLPGQTPYGLARKIVPASQPPSAIRTRMMEVPRRFKTPEDGTRTALSKFSVLSGVNRYHCPYCVNYQTWEAKEIETHMEGMHASRMIRAKGYDFVPCLQNCDRTVQTRRKLGLIHYHCLCETIFVSEEAITSHLEHCSALPKICGKTMGKGRRKEVRTADTDMESKDIDGNRAESPITFKTIPKAPKKDGTSALFEPLPPDRSNTKTKLKRFTAKFECNKCTSTFRFSSRSDLMAHNRSYHPISTDKRYNKCGSKPSSVMFAASSSSPRNTTIKHVCLFCPQCDFKSVEELRWHYENVHEIVNCCVQSMQFDDARCFYFWKSNMEAESNAIYPRRRHIVRDGDGLTALFVCTDCVSGTKRCPAFIKATENPIGSVDVAFCEYHIGHQLDQDSYAKTLKRSLAATLVNRRKQKDEIETMFDEDIETAPTPPVKDVGDCDLNSEMDYYWTLASKKLDIVEDQHRGPVAEREPKYTISVCEICHMGFKSEIGLLRHKRRMHKDEQQSISTALAKPNKAMTNGRDRCMDMIDAIETFRFVKCWFCGGHLRQMRGLISHYICAHNQSIQMGTAVFHSVLKFDEWRMSTYGGWMRRLPFSTSMKKMERYWACRESGRLHNPSCGATDAHCSAWICAKYSNDPHGNLKHILVTYCLDHVGHTMDDRQIAVTPESNEYPIPSLPTPLAQYPVGRLTISPDAQFPITLSTNGNMIGGWTQNIYSTSSTPVQISPASRMSTLVTEIRHNTVGQENQFINLMPNSELLAASNDGDSDEIQVIDSGQSAFGYNYVKSIPAPGDTDYSSNGVDANLAAIAIDAALDLRQTEYAEESNGDMDTRNNDNGAPDDHGVVENGERAAPLVQYVEKVPPKQMDLLIRSVTGQQQFMTLLLSSFPLVESEGHKYYAISDDSLIQTVSDALAQIGQALHNGDNLTILPIRN